MKKIIIGILSASFFMSSNLYSQNTNDILNLLIQNNAITQDQADSLRSEAAIKQQESDAKRKLFPVNAGKAILISGYTQIRYQNLDEKGKIDGFDIRRARLDIKGNISPYFGYRIQTDFAGSPKLLDAYAEIKLVDYFNLTIGQQKIPVSLENLASSNKLELIDRSQVVEALTARGKDVIGNHNGRDIGVQASGTLLKISEHPFLDYRIGIFNGAGINTTDNTEAKDITGRAVLHPVTGLDIAASYYDGVGKFGTPAKSKGRSRYGFELSYDLNRFSVRSEYLKGKDADIEREGYYAQAGYYIVPQKFQILGKWDEYDTDLSITKNKSTWYIAGVNYFFSPNFKLQINYTFKKEEGNTINNNMASIQMQVAF